MPAPFRAAVEAMHAYVPGEQPPAGTRLIKLNTNENPYPPSPHVVQAIMDELEAGSHPGEHLRLYSDPAAVALRNAAAEVTGMDPECILAGNGSDELLAVITRAFVSEHRAPDQAADAPDPHAVASTVAYPYPTYLLYQTMAQIQGARIATVDFPANYGTPPALIDIRARVLFLANPNSPSGTLTSLADIERMLRADRRRMLVVDEAYAAFSGQTALPLIREFENLIVLRTLSKSHSLAGMRVGLLFAQPAVVRGLHKVRDSYSLDRLAIVAGAASLRHTEWVARNTARIVATRERLERALPDLGLHPLPSRANFVFARLGSADEARAVFDHLRKAGILVRYFARRLLDDGVRITVGTDEEIDRLLQRLSER